MNSAVSELRISVNVGGSSPGGGGASQAGYDSLLDACEVAGVELHKPGDGLEKVMVEGWVLRISGYLRRGKITCSSR